MFTKFISMLPKMATPTPNTFQCPANKKNDSLHNVPQRTTVLKKISMTNLII